FFTFVRGCQAGRGKNFNALRRGPVNSRIVAKAVAADPSSVAELQREEHMRQKVGGGDSGNLRPARRPHQPHFNSAALPEAADGPAGLRVRVHAPRSTGASGWPAGAFGIVTLGFRRPRQTSGA